MAEPLLDVKDLTVRYGGVVALSSVSMSVVAGSIVGLIGPNGAGKTTFVDAMTGFTRYSGNVVFRGVPLDRQPPHMRVRHGLARTFQSAGTFDDLTVEENLLVGERRGSSWRSTVWAVLSGRSERLRPETKRLVESLDLTDTLGIRVSELSEGHRKLVSVAQALSSGPDFVLLDEPAAGLDSSESQWLGKQLEVVRGTGVTILLVDHDMDLVANVCDELVVLDFGKVIGAGSPQDVLNDPRVVSAYLGTVATKAQEPA